MAEKLISSGSKRKRKNLKKLSLSIAARLKAKSSAKEILVLVPRRKLGKEFADYANSHREAASVPDGTKFAFVSKLAFTDAEREKILLLGLIVKPDSTVTHARMARSRSGRCARC